MMDHLKTKTEKTNELDNNLHILKEVNKTIAKDMDIIKIPEFKRTKKERQFLETDFSDHLNNINMNVNLNKSNEIIISDF